jgi:tetratricopeptide (TPR) repeat protein
MGIRHHYGLDRLIAAVDPYASSYLHPGSKKPSALETIPLDDDERWMLGLVDGTKTVKETIEISPLEPIDSYRVVYWALITDIVAVKDRPSSAAVETDNPVPQDDLVSKMVAAYHAMSTMNYFEILGVDQSTPPNEIKPAYVRLAKEYHPDSLGPNVPALVEKTANQIFDLVSKAYRVLADETERKEYLKSLTGSDEGVTLEKTHDIMNAELQFQKGQVFLKKRDYISAKESFGWAVKLVPDEAEYLAYLGWALFLSAENKMGEQALTATKYLKKAASLNPSIETIQLFLGAVYKAQNLKDVATLYFKKALEINPESVEAKRELASLGVKSQQQETRGFFGPRNR